MPLRTRERRHAGVPVAAVVPGRRCQPPLPLGRDLLQAPRPLNCMLAGYFSRVMGSLLLRRTQDIMQYLQVGLLGGGVGGGAVAALRVSCRCSCALIRWHAAGQCTPASEAQLRPHA